MSEIDIITPDLIKDAEYVSEAWRVASKSRLDGIFETGRRLIEIRDKHKDTPGKWSRIIGIHEWAGKSLLPFQKTHTAMLIRISECERLSRHVGTLPDDSKILSKLASLTDERFQELIDDGTIHPNMGRKDMSEPKLSKKAWVPIVASTNSSSANRIAAIENMTAEQENGP